jgi:hypothetical protein
MNHRIAFATVAVWQLAGLLLAPASGAQKARVSSSTFTQAGSNGCGLLAVYTWNTEGTVAIVVEADLRIVQLGNGPGEFALANAPAGVRVRRDVYAVAQKDFDYCSDLKVLPSDKPARSLARSGRLTIDLQERTRATVRLEDVVFEGADGARLGVPGRLTIVARVGGFSP